MIFNLFILNLADIAHVCIGILLQIHIERFFCEIFFSINDFD